MKKHVISSLLAITAAAWSTSEPLAAPPAWAGKNAKAAHEEPHHRHHDDDRDRYRFSRDERQALHHYGRAHRDIESLPPGLRKQVARGKSLPPGWQKKLQIGHRLPDDLYHAGYPIPDDVYVNIGHGNHGYVDILIDNEVVRVLEATQTIIDVFRLNL